MRILFLSRWFPYPADNGSKIRIYNLIKQLAAKHEIALVSFADGPQPAASLQALRRHCTEIHTVTYRPFQPTRFSAIAALLSPRPRSVVDTYNQEMAEKTLKVADHFQPDLVIASQIDMAPYACLLRNTKKLLEELELTVLRDAVGAGNHALGKRTAFSLRRALTWQKHQHYVADTLRRFDACTVVSEKEYTQVKRVALSTTSVHIVPNGANLTQLRGDFGQPTPNTLVYSGAMTFDANLDAMRYFVQEMFPDVVRRNPAVNLKITGSATGVPQHELPVHHNLTLTGYLTDLRPTIAQSCVSIVPLRIGGGTRLKILESLALGTPVVTTSKGIEGLKIAHGQGVLIADTPKDFADAVLKVLNNPTLRQELSQAGRAAVQPYDWQRIGTSLNNLLEEIMLPVVSQTLPTLA